MNKKLYILITGFLIVSGYFIAQIILAENRKETKNNLATVADSQQIALISNVNKQDDGVRREAQTVAQEIESVHCKTVEKDLTDKEKLTKDDLKKVKAFCGLSTKEKEEILTVKFNEFEGKKNSREGRIVARSNSYACFYGLSLNYGIPNYGDLGLSSSACSWHDPQPLSCKQEAGVACLWGCTNSDLVLGWHKKWFASTADLEREIYSKGYIRLDDQYGANYSRAIGYGYRWQVFSDGGGWWHSEGPEPNTAFNWYAFLRDWYPIESRIWHRSC